MQAKKLTSDQSRGLVEILIKYGDLNTSTKRENFLYILGFLDEPFVANLPFDAATGEFCRKLVNELEKRGWVDSQQQFALVIVIQQMHHVTQGQLSVVKRLKEIERVLLNHKTISWLHLSDIHIGYRDYDRDWVRLEQALLDDLRRMMYRIGTSTKEQTLQEKPDLLFVTGDIAFSGEKEQYEDAARLFEKIWAITGLDKNRTFLVPGNHDVRRAYHKGSDLERLYQGFDSNNRGLNEASDQRILYHSVEDNLYSGNHLDTIRAKFQEYIHFAGNYSANPPVMTSATEYLHYVTTVAIPEKDTVATIVGLNSSLFCGQDGEDTAKCLIVGQKQINSIHRQIDNLHQGQPHLAFMLIHHPTDVLYVSERDWLKGFLEAQGTIILNGHEHTLKLNIAGGFTENFCWLKSGSIQKSETPSNDQRYHFGRYDFDQEQVTLYLRKIADRLDNSYSLTYTADIESYPKANELGIIEQTLRF